MIIKKLSLENFLCYYGSDNIFEFSDGLNIILGENGEGKTKLFEAIEWLFNGNDQKFEQLASAKKLEDTEIGENFIVKVSMSFEQYGVVKNLSRSFSVQKDKENEYSTSNFMFLGIEENSSGERSQVDAKGLLEGIFPTQIRKYSMFKGESELNIFKNEDALVHLINLFSDAKYFAKYLEKGAFLRDKAEKAVQASSKSDKKNETLYKGLEREIGELGRRLDNYQVHLFSTNDQIKKLEENIHTVEIHVVNAEALETIKKRIKGRDEKISALSGLVDENFTTALFDEKWIIVNFEQIQQEYSEKVKHLSLEKRRIQSEHDTQKGIKEGEEKAKSELMNSVVPLPVGVPSKSHMEEMLRDEICKVCNREAPKGSEPYSFMFKRLEHYLQSQEFSKEDNDKNEPLFKHDHISRLVYLSESHENNLKQLREIRTKIKDRFEFNEARKREINEHTTELEKEKDEREIIIGKSNMGGDSLSNLLKNYSAWQRDLTEKNKEQLTYQSKFNEIERELKSKKIEKDNIDLVSANTFLIKTREILRDIENIFIDTREKKFDEFVEKLEYKSNSIFRDLNVNAFTGTISFIKQKRGSKTVVEIELQEDGRPFFKPNQSLLTSMHISILFAISELATETKKENYPMIFDAPTSSFGENKTSQFLNLIYKTENQKILLIKDFIHTDKTENTLSIKKEFDMINRNKAFWVKLERPFDPNKLKTINTQVINL